MAVTYDPEIMVTAILLPRASVVTPPVTDLPFELVTAQRADEVYDAVAGTVAARSWHPDAGSYAYATRIDAFTDEVEVISSAPTAVTEALAALFPQGLVRIEMSDQVTRLTGPRSISFAPHRGGAAINSATNGCTAGPSVRIGTTTYGTTAGHCGNNGTTWNGGGDAFGYTNARPDYPNTDVARVAGSTYSPTVYQGDAVTSGFLNVVGAGDPSGAIAVTISGRSGSVGVTVTDLNTTFTDPDGTTTGLFSTTLGARAGDSGGAVHTASGSSAGMRGTVVATSGFRDFHQRWSRIADRLGVQILT